MSARRFPGILLLSASLAVLLAGAAAADNAALTIDLLGVSTASDGLLRVRGSVGDGSRGVPVAGGHDVDGDGHTDLAMAAMTADPNGRPDVGVVFLTFGDGTVRGEVDTAVVQSRVLEIWGDTTVETAGSEVWMDDVTGDGLGDLLIARQNYTPSAGREGAGALTLLIGAPAVATHAATLTPLDLRPPLPPALTLATFVGAAARDRLGIWMRTGDVTGDGIADIVVGADQVSDPNGTHRGAAYVIRGGAHLAATQTIDLISFGSTALAGHVMRIDPPGAADHFHFGATNQIADLDGNGTAEVLIAAALNRAGAGLQPPGGGSHSNGGSTDGTLYILWDDNFTGNPWTSGFNFTVGAAPGTDTVIDGGTSNLEFGEEILGGLDYDNDGNADLYVGDLTGDAGGGAFSGLGHILFDAGSLKAEADFDLDTPPAGLVTTTFLGGAPGDIAGDTALHGDFDCDGIDDLAFSSPHADRLGRSNNGVLHVFFGRTTAWPTTVDLQPGMLPSVAALRITEFVGALGDVGSDDGDTLAYSAATGAVNHICGLDLITNEMLGNGTSAIDAGNLIVLNGALAAGRAVPWGAAQVGLGLILGLCIVVLLGTRAARGSDRG